MAAIMLRAFCRVVAVGSISLLGLCLALDVILVIFRWDFVTMLETWPNSLAAFWHDWRFLRYYRDPALVRNDWDCAITSKMPVRSRVLWLLLLVPTSSIGALISYSYVYRKRPLGNPLAQNDQITA